MSNVVEICGEPFDLTWDDTFILLHGSKSEAWMSTKISVDAMIRMLDKKEQIKGLVLFCEWCVLNVSGKRKKNDIHQKERDVYREYAENNLVHVKSDDTISDAKRHASECASYSIASNKITKSMWPNACKDMRIKLREIFGNPFKVESSA